ncbi:MAG: hybrid sensor histidine kinase/response regulator, partial [Gammaproteobacteria bacterium]|nr:hybrid sensor histidine kinase/response regulator [Gammaproteobacteria bacterium]
HALEEVFEMFSQVRPDDARSEGGLGIGLSLVRTLTQLHGGTVSASSDGPGTGSVFTVRLPVVQEG